MISTLILDLDGPLLDGKRKHHQCYSDILVEAGYTPMNLDVYWEMKRNRIDRRRQLWESRAESFYEEYFKKWIDRIEQRQYLEFDTLQPAVIETLTAWKKAGISLRLLTMRKNPANLEWQLDSLGLSPLLDSVTAVSHDDKTAAGRAVIGSTATRDVLWIGDTEADIVSAKQLGVMSCAVCCGIRTDKYLESLVPDLLVQSLSEIELSSLYHCDV